MNLVDLKWQIRFLLGREPKPFYFFYSIYYKFLSHYNEKINTITNSNTQIVIEGYPRSANSSTTTHFCIFNPDVNVAHHHHVPSQIIKGVERGIPVIVLIRNPIDAIASFKCFAPQISLTISLQAYIDFYETILSYRSGYIVASFDQVFLSFATIINQINQKFKTEFKQVTSMQFLRQQNGLNERFRMELKQDRYASLLSKAFDLYHVYLEIENDQKNLIVLPKLVDSNI